jgi:hypothetical protein
VFMQTNTGFSFTNVRPYRKVEISPMCPTPRRPNGEESSPIVRDVNLAQRLQYQLLGEFYRRRVDLLADLPLLSTNEHCAAGYPKLIGEPVHPNRSIPLLVTLLAIITTARGADEPLAFQDPSAKRYELTARASQVDPRVRSHPEIDFVLEKDGKPQDTENASVDTRVRPEGRLVIWLMGNNPALFQRVNSYGLHAIRVHYANGWFARFGKEPPPADDQFLGKIRLEAATGEDLSDQVDIPRPDGMKNVPTSS